MAKIWDSDNGSETTDYKIVYNNHGKIESTSKGFGPNLESIVGICATCKYYNVVENDVHQIVLSRCASFECNLGKNKISKCTGHTPKNQMSLNEMYELAIIIDVGSSAKTINGFVGDKSNDKKGD